MKTVTLFCNQEVYMWRCTEVHTAHADGTMRFILTLETGGDLTLYPNGAPVTVEKERGR